VLRSGAVIAGVFVCDAPKERCKTWAAVVGAAVVGAAVVEAAWRRGRYHGMTATRWWDGDACGERACAPRNRARVKMHVT
jgi:hypothetical protein